MPPREPIPRTAGALAAAAAVVSGALALLTGGLSGPLAPLALGPLAASAAAGSARGAAVGGGVSAALVAALAAAEAAGLVAPGPAGIAGLLLRLLALVAAAGAVGVGLVLGLRAKALRGARPAAEAVPPTAPVPVPDGAGARAAAALEALPHLLLSVTEAGRVEQAWGAPPPGLATAVLFREGLAGAVADLDRRPLLQALTRAAEEGAADLTAHPRTAAGAPPAPLLHLELRREERGGLIALIRAAGADDARLRAAEAARAEAEAVAEGRARFLANMSHELRTPLNAIIGFSDMMRQRMFGPAPKRYEEYAQLIHESGSHLLDLIGDVLDMSKIEAARFELRLETLDAREPVKAALRLMRDQARDAMVQLTEAVPPHALEVHADRRALKQIVLNLASNALKFTPPGGSVTVSLAEAEGELELVVTDTGVGIAASELERLGRPYEQGDAGRRTQGTGLGLSLVRAFAALHGGAMTVESQEGEGATVIVRLPVLLPREETPDADGGAPLPDNIIPFAPPR